MIIDDLNNNDPTEEEEEEKEEDSSPKFDEDEIAEDEVDETVA
ncbi:MAG: hypothetical protein UV40_C0013G0011 [Parcubacteria group bacterium GW2011_GWA1_42_7]|nr:MAG: hypothetical protein UV34_C0029G0011 [Parcubacteria group bacterium GW2011_GWB1_42_6]KKS69866.1 MAG: hypothetical protein UV40_C0013G0011 [Parcubacteria group bacterium GW2011_GWA1_42_7]KKS91597.1 MAG: hypothetical protein UV67_C0024G0011 [Parcubacteria group bacterium GW2011_GWC1_43_12]